MENRRQQWVMGQIGQQFWTCDMPVSNDPR